MRSFSDLLAFHTVLDELFAEHQYALLHFKFEEALEILKRYEADLFAHMLDEEEILMPVYEERAEIERGGGVKLFLDEHEKMRQHILLFKQTTAELMSDPNPEPTLIKLLDRESFYKRLCSHHDLRESGILYPALDGVTDEAERAEMAARLRRGPEMATAA